MASWTTHYIAFGYKEVFFLCKQKQIKSNKLINILLPNKVDPNLAFDSMTFSILPSPD